MLFRGGHHGAEHKVEPAEKTSDEHTWREIGAISQSFEIGGESPVRQAAVKTRHSAHLAIGKRPHYCAKETRPNANVAVADDHGVMARFANHAAKLVDFIAGAHWLRTDEQSNRALGKIGDYFFDYRNRGIALITHAKQNFEFRVILIAEARVVFVAFAIQAVNGFQDTGGRSEMCKPFGVTGRLDAKKFRRCKDRD